jgi:hypothetical protein
MEIKVVRYKSNAQATLGKLYVNGEYVCYTLEDEKRTTKVKGETRIAAGTYEIKFRKVGGHHTKYSKDFPEIHKGMLELQNVPNFQFILIHIGNYEKDTDGCVLVGMTANEKAFTIGSSTIAYKRLYPTVADALLKGEKVTITLEDNDS